MTFVTMLKCCFTSGLHGFFPFLFFSFSLKEYRYNLIIIFTLKFIKFHVLGFLFVMGDSRVGEI